MADLEVAVRYQSKPAKLALIGVVMLLPIWGIFVPCLFGWIVFMVCTHPDIPVGELFKLCGALLGLLLITTAGVKSVLNLADNRILVTKFGIEFPFFLAHTFGLRRHFQWPAIREVQLLEGHKREIVLYTSDRFPVYLDVACLKVEELEQLLVGINLWATTCEKSPLLEQLHDELQRASDANILPSYTAMWEDELSRRFAATAYVPLEPGHILQGGRLKVVSQLSFGGLSAVYLCQRNERDLVVLKEAVVPENDDAAAKSKAMELFAREAEILMKLDHSAVVKVLDHFVEQGRQYLLIEYHTGQDLNQYVKQNGAQPEARVLDWASQVVEILVYLHEQSPPIIHRDVTPDNLVLDSDDRIVMIDFGAANEFVGNATGTLVGKQSFIAPEQFRGKACVQSDLYALGCTLHFLLTGAEPVPLSVSHPRTINEHISADVDELVASLTRMDVAARVSSALGAKSRIQALLDRIAPTPVAG